MKKLNQLMWEIQNPALKDIAELVSEKLRQVIDLI